MNAQEIKKAVDEGKKVYWVNELYEVIKDKFGRYLIRCSLNDSCIGLTWMDGITLNGKEDQFYIA